MKRANGLVVVLVAVCGSTLALAACGGSSGAKSSPSPQTSAASGTTATTAGGSGTTIHVAKLASDTPSESAKMICAKEAKNDIFNGALGVDTISPLEPKWDLATHTYSCVYHYANGAYMTLSVKEMSSPEETTAYYDQLAQQLGKVSDFQVPGSGGAFQTKNGSSVVRKDYKVMLVDMSHIPARFGVPADTPAHNSANVAFTILGCWTGA